ncbi:MAG: carboxypeptidase regulatory-like domain-containing protein [Calditrichaeota bacterium]|nr:MAG: carboxypeptidase regulatory-like domain-containing protein [Calditrichota bacterium]
MAFACRIIFACTGPAPHSHPLHPASPTYNSSGQVSGRCRSIYDTSIGIPGVKIILQSVGELMPRREMITETDGNGEFLLDAVAPDSYQVVFQKPGFAEDTARFRLRARGRQEINIGLDALPVLNAAAAFTGHALFGNPIEERYYLTFDVQLTDPDRNLDIESVEAHFDSLGIIMPLLPNTDHSQWHIQVVLDSLQVSQPSAYIGTPFSYKVKTNTNFKPKQINFGPFFLVRFIHQKLEIVFPKNDAIVDGHPVFQWKPVQVPFPFSYRILISRILSPGDFESTQISDIHADSTYKRPSRLLRSKYFWSISLVDEFGNWTRSREETFEVRQ